MQITYKNTRYTIKLGTGNGLTRGVVLLGGIIIVVFFITSAQKELFYPLFGFIPSYFIGKFRIWQLVTANLLHANSTHLMLNLIGLWMFGTGVEKHLKAREFIKYFFICGMGGYFLVYFLWAIGFLPNNLSVGASAGIYGLLLAFCLLNPNQLILLFFIVPMQAKWLAILFGGLEFLLSFQNNGISHIGHFGGLLMGLLYFVFTNKIVFTKGIVPVMKV